VVAPVHKIIWHEAWSDRTQPRQNEPAEAMEDPDQVRSYVEAYEWGGPTSALKLHHLRELARLIRPGDTVLDLACGPGPLILDLAPLYPDVRFIGADLSSTMLQYLRREATARHLDNVVALEEDIRTLPSLANGSVDLVMTTSALHHLPCEDDVRRVFRRMRTLLKPGGGFYAFDFALLKSSKSRALLVADVARLAPALTVRDYELSLAAAFPLDRVLAAARLELPRPFVASSSAFIDFFYFLQTPKRVEPSTAIAAHLRKRWLELSVSMKGEHMMLRLLRRSATVS
jgi:SAM-dependent methyltransferase